MEQEGVTLIILVTSIIVLIFSIAMIVLFIVFQNRKNKLLIDNKTLNNLIKDNISSFDI